MDEELCTARRRLAPEFEAVVQTTRQRHHSKGVMSEGDGKVLNLPYLDPCPLKRFKKKCN
jgi:hypothetical protein